VLVAALVVAVAGAVAGLGIRARLDPGRPVTGVASVALVDNGFSPPAVSVPAGTTVTWRFTDGEPHNVVGDGFASPVQQAGTFRHTFAGPGRFDYRCTLHTFMRGRVVVTPAR
jgi:plastocyanin